MKLPRPSTSIQHRIVKTLCGLSPSSQRRLFGAPPSVDGQTLASDLHALLRILAISGTKSIIDGLSVEAARAKNRLGAAAVAERPAIPMARVEAMELPGRVGGIPARLYVPEELRKDVPMPLLVYFHGGGWVMGDLDTHDGVCRFLAAQAEVAILSVGYRLAPEHPFPAGVEDAWDAYSWTVANAEALGAEGSRIAIGGDSAGGNLAAAIALLAREGSVQPPAMQLLIYPATDLVGPHRSRELFADGFLLTKADTDRCERLYLGARSDRADPRASVLRAPDLRDLPPAYVATAGFDPLRDEGEVYALRMREAGVAVTLQRHPGLIHIFANETAVSRSARAAMMAAAAALTRELKRPPRGRSSRSTSEIHLLGAFSNPEAAARLEMLAQLLRRILARTPVDPPRRSVAPRRMGDVSKAIVRVLSDAREPMHTSSIHRAVERHLTRPVSYRTVKACLSADTQAKSPRFERVARGEYCLRR